VTSGTDALSPQQLVAVEALLSGQTHTEAAEAAGVSRQTVHRWRNESPVFQAAFNRARNELAAAVEARLRKLALRALDAVETSVEQGNAASALAVLKGLGLLDGKQNTPDILRRHEEDPEELAHRADLHERECALSRQSIENQLRDREIWVESRS
jgi:hypothetical protein